MSAPRGRIPTRRTMVRRLLALYADTPENVRAAGREWYREGAATVAAIGGELEHERAAAIVAALSPRVRWRTNVRMAARIIAGAEVGGLPRNIAKAEAIRDGAEPETALGARAFKVRAFWRNLAGDGDAVTVDVWAQRAATGRRDDAPPGTARQYDAIADAYRAAARIVGERPCDFQAIIWLSVRPISEHSKDTTAIGGIAA